MQASSSSTSSSSSRQIDLEFICIDRYNIQYEYTNIFVKAASSMQLSVIDKRIRSRLHIDSLEELEYTNTAGDKMELSKTIEEVGLKNNEKIFVDYKKTKVWTATMQHLADEISKANSIELICETRVGADDDRLRRIKVIVNPYHYCHDMLEEVSCFFERSGLKFKCGRVVLRGDKTFHEQGVENGNVIVVTGGRG